MRTLSPPPETEERRLDEPEPQRPASVSAAAVLAAQQGAGNQAVARALARRPAGRVLARMDPPPYTVEEEEAARAPQSGRRHGTLRRQGKDWWVEVDGPSKVVINVLGISGKLLTKQRIEDGTPCWFEVNPQSLAFHIEPEVKETKEKRHQTASGGASPLEQLEVEATVLLGELRDAEAMWVQKTKGIKLDAGKVEIPQKAKKDLKGLLDRFNQTQRFGSQKEEALIELLPRFIAILKYLSEVRLHPLFRGLVQCGFIEMLAQSAAGKCHNAQTGSLLTMLEGMRIKG
ncbi:MAG: hypothetical protein J7474_08160 [Arthrobacter sp.]|nr:hypothetical protein [Arthrobacter sp.]